MVMDNEAEMNENFEKFLDKIKNEYKDGWTEENWEREMERHPFFMTKMPENEEDFSPELEALRQIKWDESETAEDKALKYKEEGNLMFKHKNYKKAVASYTMALKQEINDINNPKHAELISVLHSNRAAAHFYLKNFRSALNDCIFSYKFNRNYIKPVLKASECCFELKMFDDCARWCEIALSMEKNNEKARELMLKCEASKKSYEKDKRKKEANERKLSDRQKKMLSLIKANKLEIYEDDAKFLDLISSQMEFPIKLVDEGDSDGNQPPHLAWPVVFLYPEFGQTDFIQGFDEFSIFEDQLSAMFTESPAWDTERKYNSESVQIYYENQKKKKLVKLNKSSTLIEALKKEGYVIQLGTPKFILLVKNSEFERIYIEKYSELSH